MSMISTHATRVLTRQPWAPPGSSTTPHRVVAPTPAPARCATHALGRPEILQTPGLRATAGPRRRGPDSNDRIESAAPRGGGPPAPTSPSTSPYRGAVTPHSAIHRPPGPIPATDSTTARAAAQAMP